MGRNHADQAQHRQRLEMIGSVTREAGGRQTVARVLAPATNSGPGRRGSVVLRVYLREAWVPYLRWGSSATGPQQAGSISREQGSEEIAMAARGATG